MMIKLKKLLPEQNSKSKYELLMDLISDFLELQDSFNSRMIDIEKKLKELKPQLSKSDNRLDPEEFSTDNYMKSMEGDDIG
jgi:hypothetical protein